DADRHADHQVGLGQGEASADLFDEVAQHRLGDHVVRDDAVAHGAGDLDVLRRAAKHGARFFSDGDALVIADAQRHDRWLLQDNAPAPDVNDRVDGAEVNADLFGEQHESPFGSKWPLLWKQQRIVSNNWHSPKRGYITISGRV